MLLQKKKAGISALLYMMLVLSALSLMAAGVGNLARHRLNVVARDAYDTRARYAAYTGIQFGLLQLTLNPGYAPTEPVVSPLPGDENTFFELTVVNNFAGAEGSFLETPDGIQVPAGTVALESNGVSVRGSSETSFSVKTLAFRGDRRMRYAILADEDIVMNNSHTDAFRSFKIFPADGLQFFPYDPAAPPESNPGAPGQGKGTLRVNKTEPGSVMLSGSQVNGHVVVGPLGDPDDAIVMEDGSVISFPTVVGAALHRVSQFRPPLNPSYAVEDVVVTGNQTLPPGAYRSITVRGGGTLTLSGDYYLVSGDLRIEGGTVEVDPTVTGTPTDPQAVESAVLCVGGDVLATAGSSLNQENPEALPYHLQIVGVGDGRPGDVQRFELNGTTARMIILGSTFDIEMNGSSVAGAIKCKRATLNNSSVHFDRNLANTGVEHFGLNSWALSGMAEDDLDVGSFGGAAAAAAAGGDAAAAAAAAGGDAGDAAGDAGVGDAAGDAAAAAGDAAAAAGDAAAGDAAAGDATGGDGDATSIGDGDAAVGDGDAAGGDAAF